VGWKLHMFESRRLAPILSWLVLRLAERCRRHIQRLHTHPPFINHAVRGSGCAGEASSNTFTSANGIYLRGFRGDKPWVQWAGVAATNATMPALLREAQPYLRLILMLRHPTTR
jgi:hypothetical protein